MNAFEIEESVKSLVSKGFNPKTFIIDFLKAYDAPKSLIQQLKGDHQNLSDISGGVLWRRNLHYKLADKGMVPSVITELRNSQATSKYKVRFVISTDGEEFSAHDLNTGNTVNCNFDEIDIHFASFLSLAGIFFEKEIEENPIDIQATKRLTKFYDSILQDNPDWKTDEMRHTLNHFITQIIFCLFAEDTGIIPKDIFSSTVRLYCENDSEQAKPVIEAIFTAMAHDAGAEVRSGLPGYTQKFPHVNGGLFRGNPQVPRFLRGSVRYLLDAGVLDWKEINPDIFGSMIQAIVHQDQRGELGMHYTSVSNILKLLKPLFLNDLQDQVNANWNSKKGLQAILQRLMKIRVFDPACGSGNFLVIAYRELRNIEIQVIRRLAEISDFSAGLWSHVDLKNFFGIEYIDFAAETAKLSLWIAEYQMNKRYEDEFGKFAPSLPLKDTNTIQQGNALRISWEDVCPHSDDSEVETYIVGNPPYLGRQKRNEEQQEDMEKVFSAYTSKYANLDYVAGWFLKSSTYMHKHNNVFAALVSTNSISQGEQVSLLWSALNKLNIKIIFAHTSFKWKNSALKNAGVVCVIIGIGNGSHGYRPTIYSDNTLKYVDNITPYLTSGTITYITPRKKPLSFLPEMDYGSMANDGGGLLLSPDEANTIVSEYPNALKFIKRIYGGQEFIKGIVRYGIWINHKDLDEAMKIPYLENRIYETRKNRLDSKREATQKLASVSYRFSEVRHTDQRKLIIPNLTTDKRKWFTVGFLEADDVVIAPSLAINGADFGTFAIASSKLHFVWISSVCGRFKTDIRYSNTLGWHTFPIQKPTEQQYKAIEELGKNILLARDAYFEHQINTLYDPNRMSVDFPKLYEAHIENDRVIEEILSGHYLYNDTERLDFLLSEYESLFKNRV
ncbi:lactate dehydrogenase [Roseovarius mucosus]|uniref:site-specific DNA-methyltransferase (adenine-specific) n=1 Tax=Roseovarius mucosus TaxID=215743 RepID=A0A1V0RRS9_9RHOB|nr:DNA methyltransferase [Roseovarius mucosus]ARE84406.1 lactate dehydrogenase [Roseovarius mucosus]